MGVGAEVVRGCDMERGLIRPISIFFLLAFFSPCLNLYHIILPHESFWLAVLSFFEACSLGVVTCLIEVERFESLVGCAGHATSCRRRGVSGTTCSKYNRTICLW